MHNIRLLCIERNKDPTYGAGYRKARALLRSMEAATGGSRRRAAGAGRVRGSKLGELIEAVRKHEGWPPPSRRPSPASGRLSG